MWNKVCHLSQVLVYNQIMIRTKKKKKPGSDLTAIQKVLKNLATKDDLKKFVTKDEFNNAISGLPSKAEFYEKMDEVMGELSTVREEITILSDMKRQVNDVEDRMETVESKLGIAF